MAGARNALIVVLLGVAVAICAWQASGEATVTSSQGRARADALIVAYARHLGATGRTLDSQNDAAFGGSGLHYDPTRNQLVGRAYVQPALLDDAPAAEVANLRRMVGFLNDPKVGGMYDRAGATFVLDESRDAYFLVRAFPVDGTTPEQLNRAMDAMVTVSASWVVRWFYEVAGVMHGHRPPPDHPVTVRDVDR